ncbi:hypothetical protein SEA_FORZA_169 [Gordonia phage Forza]|uniref:DNA helicase n=1 Tax=Gordonia phage Forza TaxID=2571247 RepID=A0A650EYL2_9CAUD|nr:hypothetical protein PP303_gp159 [Gordonia phage Forza]QEM41604.1 hypothetical protein SEA_BOOPY_168 [Gordonia phage Boopy]QGT55130.1 hypothetical protein SEA_FORZA_169 [Gordonia phage Forza]UXE04278.1 hypothetical protein SEA_BLUENGOLD_165 [Gordonia phage BlueNGold]WBF03919.1 hypothetical protein SEA_MAREELIH_166 [Gordonia phage Mareelih]
MANSLPVGVSRGKYVEIATKSGHNISGDFVREREGTVYLKFQADGKDVIASTDLEGIDVFMVGPKSDGTTDEAATLAGE